MLWIATAARFASRPTVAPAVAPARAVGEVAVDREAAGFPVDLVAWTGAPVGTLTREQAERPARLPNRLIRRHNRS
jgi:hypothetical protein